MAETHAEAIHRHEAPKGFIWKYIFSLDHKVIGIQYYFLALFSVFVGLTLSILMRLHLVWPHASVPLLDKLSPIGAPGGVISPEYYLSLLTLHGTLMVFFVLTTAPQSGFGNYFLPIQIGAEDMAFPRLNMMSFWVTFLGLVVLMATFFISDGPPIGGWTSYPPLSAVGGAAGPGMAVGETLWVFSIAIFCVASMLGAINFIATTLDLRARGLSLMKLPLTCWAWFFTAILGLLSFAVLLAAGALLLLDRMGGTSFFIPGGLIVSDKILSNHTGGSPLLWQHLFWFFGHPEVYIAILPGMGVTSHILSTFARKPIFGYRAMVYAMAAIGILGFTVWGHHMFVSGMSPYSAFAFSILTMAIGVPSAIKTFNWIGTLLGGQDSLRHPHALRHRFCLHLRHRRTFRNLFGPAAHRHLFSRHLLCPRPLPLDHGRGGHLWHVRRNRFLVPQNVRPDDERDGGEDSFLDHFRRRVRHFHAHALPGPGRESPALLGVH